MQEPQSLLMKRGALKRNIFGDDELSGDEVIQASLAVKRKHPPAPLPLLLLNPSEAAETDGALQPEVWAEAEGGLDGASLSMLGPIFSKEESDYQSMVIPEEDRCARRPVPLCETQPSSQERQLQSREDGLNRSLFAMLDEPFATTPPMVTSSKGLAMMAKMGFKIGDKLGKDASAPGALSEPLRVQPQRGRVGLGSSALTKPMVEPVQVNHSTTVAFRARVASEKSGARLKGVVALMQAACVAIGNPKLEFQVADIQTQGAYDATVKKLPVEWRGAVVVSLLQEQAALLRGRGIPGAQAPVSSPVDDPELRLFNLQAIEERMELINEWLRTAHAYCYWCGVKYKNVEELQSQCPGKSEVDHQ